MYMIDKKHIYVQVYNKAMQLLKYNVTIKGQDVVK
jgi:hypothetical protein